MKIVADYSSFATPTSRDSLKLGDLYLNAPDKNILQAFSPPITGLWLVNNGLLCLSDLSGAD